MKRTKEINLINFGEWDNETRYFIMDKKLFLKNNTMYLVRQKENGGAVNTCSFICNTNDTSILCSIPNYGNDATDQLILEKQSDGSYSVGLNLYNTTGTIEIYEI